MAFASITLDAEELVLLDAETLERGEALLTLEHGFSTRIAESLTLRESRSKNQLAMRTSASLALVLPRTEAAALRTALATLGKKRVALPVWTDTLAKEAVANSVYAPQYWLRLDTRAPVATADVASLPANTSVCPLLVGRIRRPELTPLDRHQARVRLELDEQGPFAWRLEVRDLGEDAGAFPAGLEPNWVYELTDRSADQLEESALGRGREPLIRGVDGVFKWGQGGRLTLRRADAARLLAHWQANAGRWGAFTAPVWFRPHLSASSETPDGIVARYASDLLRVEWHHESTDGVFAEIGVELWQLPWEATPPAGEAFELPAEAFLYRLSYEVPPYAGGPVLYHYTDWESALAYGGETYLARPIEHGRLQEAEDFRPARTDLKMAQEEGSPLLLAARGEAEALIRLRLLACDPADPAGTAEELLEEYLGEVEASDREITADVGYQEPPELPRIVVSREGNQVPEELWQIRVAEVVAKDGAAQVISLAWQDGDRYPNPEPDRFNGWKLIRETDQTWKSITDHAQLDETTADASVTVAAWSALTVGDHVWLASPYVRFGSVSDIWDDPSGPYAKKYLIAWTDGGSNPANNYLDGGTVEAGSGASFEARPIAYQFYHDASLSAIVTRRPFRNLAVSDAVIVFPGWDGTWTQLSSRYPLAADHVALFPFVPETTINTTAVYPYEGESYGKK